MHTDHTNLIILKGRTKANIVQPQEQNSFKHPPAVSHHSKFITKKPEFPNTKDNLSTTFKNNFEYNNSIIYISTCHYYIIPFWTFPCNHLKSHLQDVREQWSHSLIYKEHVV